MNSTTPIQQAIEKLEAEIFGLENTQANIMGRDIRVFQAKQDIILLESLLPTEKQFVSDVWNAATNRNTEEYVYTGMEDHVFEEPSKQQLIDKYYKP